MAFGLGKLAVLESKLDIYEDLSKEMLDKLERAVGTISDNSNKVAIILERHENRLDDQDKTDKLLVKMFEDMKQANREDHKKVNERIDKLEVRIAELQKVMWGVGLSLSVLVSIINLLPMIGVELTPKKVSATMGSDAVAHELHRNQVRHPVV